MANPNNIIHGPANVTISGNAVGYTKGGVTLRNSNEKLDIEADQATGVVLKPTIMQKQFVSFTMLESTVQNLVDAMEANTAGSGDVDFGEDSPVTPEHTLVITGKAPSGATRTYTFYRAVVAEDVEHLIGAREAVGEIPVTFELLKDATQGGKFGYFADA